MWTVDGEWYEHHLSIWVLLSIVVVVFFFFVNVNGMWRLPFKTDNYSCHLCCLTLEMFSFISEPLDESSKWKFENSLTITTLFIVIGLKCSTTFEMLSENCELWTLNEYFMKHLEIWNVLGVVLANFGNYNCALTDITHLFWSIYIYTCCELTDDYRWLRNVATFSVKTN